MKGEFDFIKEQLSQNPSLIKHELERPGRRLVGDFSHRMAYLAGVEDAVKVLNESWKQRQKNMRPVKKSKGANKR
jgi:hypothetical protein